MDTKNNSIGYLSLLLLVTATQVVLLCSCTNNTQRTFLVTKSENSSIEVLKDGFCYELKLHNADAAVDTLAGGNNIIIITPQQPKSESILYFDTRKMGLGERDLKEIEFYGHFTHSGVEQSDLKIELVTILLSDGVTTPVDSLIYTIGDLNNVWNDFSVKSKPDNYTFFSLMITLKSNHISNKLIISDLGLRINGINLETLMSEKFPAQKDTEFDKGSDFQLSSANPFLIETLFLTGKLWGFLKYYHPEIVKGKYNCDSELFRLLPQICSVTNDSQRNKIFNRWIDRYKYRIEIDSTDFCLMDQTQYSRTIDLEWLSDTTLFDDALVEKLDAIRRSKRSSKLNYYIQNEYPALNIDYFNREKRYENISWEDQGFRLLTLFKIWNLIEYCYPYQQLTDCDWDGILRDFISDFLFPETELDYKISILRLCANLKDTHTVLMKKRYNDYVDETISDYLKIKKKFRHAYLVKMLAGEVVVKESLYPDLHVGDQIERINGEEIDEIADRLSGLISMSNHNINRLSPYILSSSTDSMVIDCLRNGKKVRLTVKENVGIKKSTLKNWKDYNLNDKGVVYVKNEIDIKEQIPLHESKGIIVDLRTYGCEHFFMLANVLMNEEKCYAWITKNDKKAPGNFKVNEKNYFGEVSLEKKYHGKVMILVDEITTSQSETMALALRSIPNSLIIGNMTAGANGNVLPFQLPGGLIFNTSMVGFYYPDLEILQRNGVKIDIPVDYLPEKIKHGADLWIEKALEQIMQ